MKTLLLAAALAAVHAHAEITVTDAWARATIAPQTTTGAYMKIRSTEPAKVIAAASPVAGLVEIHEMSLKDNVMRMGAVEALKLSPGTVFELKPGGYHVMLMGLARPLAAGETLPIMLTVEDAKGRRRTIDVKATVRGSR